MDLEIDKVVPVGHPLIEQPPVIRLHKLVTAVKLFVYPARQVEEPFRLHTAAVPKPAIHENGIFIPEVLHYHVCRHSLCMQVNSGIYLFVLANYPFR